MSSRNRRNLDQLLFKQSPQKVRKPRFSLFYQTLRISISVTNYSGNYDCFTGNEEQMKSKFDSLINSLVKFKSKIQWFPQLDT